MSSLQKNRAKAREGREEARGEKRTLGTSDEGGEVTIAEGRELKSTEKKILREREAARSRGTRGP